MAIYIGKGTNKVEKTATLGGDASVYISDSWNASKNYITGDYAIHENNLWKCKANNSNTVPTEGTYWARVLVTDEIETLNENLTRKVDANIDFSTYGYFEAEQPQYKRIDSLGLAVLCGRLKVIRSVPAMSIVQIGKTGNLIKPISQVGLAFINDHHIDNFVWIDVEGNMYIYSKEEMPINTYIQWNITYNI